MTTQKKNSRLSARAILCQVLGMLMALTVALPTAAGDAKSVHDEVKNSVVAVYDGKEEADLGSGVIVGEGIVVTNFHVIEGVSKTDIQIWKSADEHGTDWYYVEAEIAWCEERQDLCLLYAPDVLDTPNAKIATMGEANLLSIGEEVYTFGNPDRFELSMTRGIVSKLNYDLRKFPEWEFDFGFINAPIVQTDADILAGSSGGGLFNEDGELIGITTFTKDPGRDIDKTELSFAMPVELVAELLAQGSVRAKDGDVAAALVDALRHHAGVGNVRAQFDLGWFYDQIDADNETARYQLTDGERWLVGSSPDLFNRLVDMKAVEWYTHAAEQGHLVAQYNLAISYDEGTGADENKTAAARWFERVVNAEHYGLSPFAAWHLGWLYDNGQVEIEHGEVATAKEKAAATEEYTGYLFDKAAGGFLALAEIGELDSDGQYYLAELYKEGKGVEKSNYEAYIWFFIAAENGDEDAAAEVEKMRREFDADGIREAEAEAKEKMEEMNSEE